MNNCNGNIIGIISVIIYDGDDDVVNDDDHPFAPLIFYLFSECPPTYLSISALQANYPKSISANQTDNKNSMAMEHPQV